MAWYNFLPGVGAAISTIAGVAKSRSDNKEYKRQMENRKRRAYFSAFTGDNVNETPEFLVLTRI